jgi:hypothetical protein
MVVAITGAFQAERRRKRGRTMGGGERGKTS